MKQLRRLAVAIIGGTVLLFGIALIVLPGPAILVIPLGLTILALEFAWAKDWLQKFRDFVERRKAAFTGKPPESTKP